MDIVDRNSEPAVDIDAEQQFEQVASGPPVETHLRRSNRVQQSFKRYSSDEYVFITDEREPKYYA